MTNNLFRETLLYGNLENIFSLRQIKNFNIEEIFEIMKEFKLSHNGIYRYFINFKSILVSKELELIQESNPHKNILLRMMENIIEKANEMGVFANNTIIINILDYNSIVKVFIYNLLNLLENKFKTHMNDNKSVIKLFNSYFKKLGNTYRNEIIVIDYVTSFENNIWSPSWKIIYKNKSYYMEGIDVFIDNVFLNPNIRYNRLLYFDIKNLDERIIFLKNNTKEYYNNYLKDYTEKLTHHMFSIFPFQAIYYQYYTGIKNHPEFYKPPLLKLLDDNDFNKDSYIMSILPPYISAYLLGFPILKCDTPADKNLIINLRKFNEEYYDNLAQKYTKKIIELNSFGISCGNNTDEDNEYTDINFNRIIDFNIDDICQIFNNGVYHLFTSPEFENILKNESNFYNRSKINILNPIIYNLKFKKKIKRYLTNRGLNIKLQGTLRENYNEIKEEIRNKNIPEINSNNNLNEENLNNPILNLFFSI